MSKSMEELDRYIESIYIGQLKKKNKPELLYQYTDITALKGIVKDQVLWATHFRYLNDKRELDYGLRLAVKYANSAKIKATDSNVIKLLDEISKSMNLQNKKKNCPFILQISSLLVYLLSVIC